MVTAMLDLFSIAVIIPFLAVVAQPNLLDRNTKLAWFSRLLGLGDRSDKLVFLAAVVFAIVMIGIAGRAATFHFLTRFSRLRALSMAVKLMRLFLARSYLWHVERESADLSRKALDEVREVVNGPLNASLRLIANSSVLVLIVAMLVILQPMGAIVSIGLVALCYGTAFALIQQQLATMGREWQKGNAYRYRVMQEAMGVIREVKLFGLQEFYVERYREPAERVARSVARINTLADLPRHLLEAIAFGGMLLFLILMLIAKNGDITMIVPIVGVYAIAGVRLFPIVQSIYRDITTLEAGEALIESLHLELTAADAHIAVPRAETNMTLAFEQSLQLRNVSFAFPQNERPALADCSLTIRRGAMVGFAGVTGAGKSTLIDIISGLIPPDDGRVLVDGTVIDGRTAPAWRTHIGYVPQSIFLVDDTVAANIAFGVEHQHIDMDRVREAARMAQIDQFVMDHPDGYQMRSGERGKRMSGGQRQRIAIARALYRRPSFLIFDEATSALDPGTEAKVMQAIAEKAGHMSIVLIAHRLETLRRCETIHVLDRGRIAASGSYEDLAASSAVFRALQGVPSA